MLFLSTKKYPNEAEFDEFLNSHGGLTNAFTDIEDTVFYFEVNYPHLDLALDRFAQVFSLTSVVSSSFLFNSLLVFYQSSLQ